MVQLSSGSPILGDKYNYDNSDYVTIRNDFDRTVLEKRVGEDIDDYDKDCFVEVFNTIQDVKIHYQDENFFFLRNQILTFKSYAYCGIYDAYICPNLGDVSNIDSLELFNLDGSKNNELERISYDRFMKEYGPLSPDYFNLSEPGAVKYWAWGEQKIRVWRPTAIDGMTFRVQAHGAFWNLDRKYESYCLWFRHAFQLLRFGAAARIWDKRGDDRHANLFKNKELEALNNIKRQTSRLDASEFIRSSE